ncbi:CD59 glycoprotein-like isoform X2 [Dendrobates tinctorius]|uniref:CD59 glycoprotein-like isoform X2 n=1 Tax=Dendrobates tinctorius TaxID=92724 RepID=UPI003CC979BE
MFRHIQEGPENNGIMRSPGIGCVLLTFGLVFLSLCSTVQAIKCFTCSNWSISKCVTNATCADSEDACMRVTRSTGESQYSCRVYSKCNSDLVSQENNGMKNFELKCCQKDLCNDGLTASPSTVLLLSLAAALLLLSS